MKKAFTLAEVLIVIGVIGVVAALTIPVLMTNIKAAQFRSKIKKELSVLNQAVRLNKANTGVDFSNVCSVGDGSRCLSPEDPKIYDIFKNNLKEGASKKTAVPSYKCSSIEEDDETYCINDVIQGNGDEVMNIDLDGVFVHLDGAHFAIPGYITTGDCHTDFAVTDFNNYSSTLDLRECVSWIDVNGPEGPNKEVNCTTGTYSTDLTEPCTVSNKDVTDVYPVLFIDSTVMPATNAAKAVLGGK